MSANDPKRTSAPEPPPTWPVSLSDAQLQIVMLAAGTLTPEKRGVLLERVGTRLRLRNAFTDGDVEAAIRSALAGLAHEPAA